MASTTEDEASGLVNLDTFLSLKKPINSPRSLEACLRQGLDVAELYEKYVLFFMMTSTFGKLNMFCYFQSLGYCEYMRRSVEEFVKEGKPEHIAQMMYEHYEMRRTEKIKAARGERKMIIEYLEQLKVNGYSLFYLQKCNTNSAMELTVFLTECFYRPSHCASLSL